MTENKAAGGRTCANCACAYTVEPPRVPTAEQLRDNPALGTGAAQPVLICCLNPPLLMQGPDGRPKLSQMPTAAYFSCWHWKPEGTLPGDEKPNRGHESANWFPVSDR